MASITRNDYEDLYIEPLKDAHAMKRGLSKGLGHIAYRKTKTEPFECGVTDDSEFEYDIKNHNVDATDTIPERYLKVHLVADYYFYEMRGDETCRCIATVFAAVTIK